jgi:KR domain/Phosphopantetheine attachment site
MTVGEFHETIGCKVKGTWNLHTASLSQHTPLDFFTLLSSISGVIGQKGQANYAAANAFLDSFASYRQSMGLPASSVDLGVVEDVGYVAEHSSELQTSFDKDIWTPINESLLHQILRFSILQQTATAKATLNPASASQLITGIAIPQPSSSPLLKRDPRFSSLYFGSASNTTQLAGSGNNNDNNESKQIRAFLLSLHSAQPAEHSSLLASAVEILSAQFSSSLRLSEPMEPAKPLASYGLDSLAAVEFRNWARLELGAELTTLEIMGATSLFALGERIIAKIKVTAAEAAGGKET